MDYPDIIKNHDRATGRDKMVINMKELKEKKINSNIIKDQHNKYRSFRRAYNIPLKYELIF